jgi:hypothetical protein
VSNPGAISLTALFKLFEKFATLLLKLEKLFVACLKEFPRFKKLLNTAIFLS